MKNKYTLFFCFLLVAVQSFALKPKKDYITTPDSLGLAYTGLQVTTPDNYKLNTWVMKPDKHKDKKTVMVVAYGDAMNMSYWLEQCGSFIADGFTVITFDYRGFGHSSVFAMDSNQLYYDEFGTDLGSVMAYARSEFKGYKVGVRPLSMGTAIATIVCSKDPFDFFIGDSFICDPLAMEKQLKIVTGRDFLLPAGADTYKDKLSKLQTPMLVFSGSKDESTTLNDARNMIAGHPERKLVSYNGGHLEGIFVLSGKSFGAEYIADIDNFLDANKLK